jgi:aminopeptidase N
MSSPSEAAEYFQQKVYYQIEVKLNNDLNRLEASQKLCYFNHSSDTLTFLYFHLYMNKFKENPPSSREYGYQEIITVKSPDGKEISYEIDRTIMRIELPNLLIPGDSVEINFRFNVLLPEASDRLGYYGDHYDVGNWYPTPAVYDVYGWHADQHYEGEFYQEWADYLVEITVPDGFIVGATGELLNQEALPDSIEYEMRNNIYGYNQRGDWVTYKFHAQNVHDFAWSADPAFVYREVEVDNIKLIFLILPYRMEDWSPQIEIAADALRLFQNRIGPYPYNRLTIVDGYVTAGGIEYPQFVIINDMIYDSSSLSATIIHEIAHQWFYGILANNQTSYGWMDEGFTTFFENFAMEKLNLYNPTYQNSPSGFWGKYFGFWYDRRRSDLLLYLRYIRSGQEEPINCHFDRFQYDPFIPYYQKMGLVISQLHLVLKDSLFWIAIQDYYNRWKFKHPHPTDLIYSMEKTSNRNLKWFFNQWLNTTWHCDYSVIGFKGKWSVENDQRQYKANFQFKRNEPILMPVDFRVYFSDGSHNDYRIPVSPGKAIKSNDGQEISVWEHNKSEKKVHLNFPKEVKKIQIAPDGKLLDVNPFNNSSGRFPKLYLSGVKRQYLYPHNDGYTTSLFPFLFYNQVDGIQIGLRSRGNFLYTDYKHHFHLLLGLRSFLPEVDFWFEHPLYSIHRNLHFISNIYYMTGVSGTGIWLQWESEYQSEFTNFTMGWQWRNYSKDSYFPYPIFKGNISFLELKARKGYWTHGFFPLGAELSFHAESSFLGSDFPYVKWEVGGLSRILLWFNQNLTVNLTTGGINGSVPLQKVFRYGGGPTYEFLQNPYLRAEGIIPQKWWEDGNVFNEGGGELRSLANQWEPPGNYYLSGYFSMTLGNPMNLSRTYIPYFSDFIMSTYTAWATSAGKWGRFSKYLGEVGLTLSITRLPFLLNYFDLDQIHFDFPIWVNRNISETTFKFRWTIRLDIRKFE